LGGELKPDEKFAWMLKVLSMSFGSLARLAYP